MGALRLLNALKGQVQDNKLPTRGLMLIDVKINGKATRAMVDTGATHNFVAEPEAKRLGLRLEKDSSKIKAVNSAARAVHGTAKAVPIEMGKWSGRTNLMAIPMDDFQVLLGLELLFEAKAVPMPYLESLCMFGENPCMIPAATKGNGDGGLLSALKLKKGLKKGERTYLVALKLDTTEQSQQPIPREVLGLLNQYKD